jgi:hypothetical protein
MSTPTARPPILRFLLLFGGLLGVATLLAALSWTVDAPAADSAQSPPATAH